MVFAVEEINRNSSLLPGVKLGYRIMDSCDHVHTSLQALLSLVSHYKPAMGEVKDAEETQERSDMLNNNGSQNEGEKIGNIAEDRMDRSTQTGTVPSCMLNSPVPAVIGLASSSPTRAVAHTLGPFNIPLVRQGGKGGSFTLLLYRPVWYVT